MSRDLLMRRGEGRWRCSRCYVLCVDVLACMQTRFDGSRDSLMRRGGGVSQRVYAILLQQSGKGTLPCVPWTSSPCVTWCCICVCVSVCYACVCICVCACVCVRMCTCVRERVREREGCPALCVLEQLVLQNVVLCVCVCACVCVCV